MTSASGDATDGDDNAGPRVWQRMLSGRRLDLLAPRADDIELEDIAHGLARVARWNGQTLGDHAFSVAQHSLVVEQLVGELAPGCATETRLIALLHDGPEYVIGDLISPFKAVIGDDYRAVEHRLFSVMLSRFGLPEQPGDAVMACIKQADRISAFYEATRLAGFSEDEAARYFGQPVGLSGEQVERMAQLTPWSVADAQAAFVARFDDLWRS